MRAEIGGMTISMSPLQLGLIIAGVALVVGVLIYNAWDERRVRRRIEATFRKPAPGTTQPVGGGWGYGVEPTLRSASAADTAAPQGTAAYRPGGPDESDSDFQPPME